MPALHDIIAIVKSHQMTLRNIPEKANRKLRDVARREGKSLNRVTLEALERGLGIADEQVEYHDLDDLAGTWVEDPEFDRVIGEMDRGDPELWK